MRDREAEKIAEADIAAAIRQVPACSGMTAEVMTANMADEIHAFSLLYFPANPIEKRYLNSILTEGHGGGIVLRTEGGVQAFIFCEFNRGTRRVYISEIDVAASYRGRGLGGYLIGRIEALALEKGYYTLCSNIRTDNEASLHLHERAGFHVIRTVEKYFDDGSDAFYLRKQLLHKNA
jgi:ribosomal-protein-alanine N-acetyltransferase